MFGGICEVCERFERADGTALEVCWSEAAEAHTCLSCHFAALEVKGDERTDDDG